MKATQVYAADTTSGPPSDRGAMCVIFNPTSGRGRGAGRVERLRRALAGRAEFRATAGSRHAEQLALEAAQEGFAVVAAAGGDGTVHEVANGIVRAGQSEVALAVLPIGSANDYANSLGQTLDPWLRRNRILEERRVDVGLVRAATGRERWFVNGLGLGFNGAVTLEACQLRRLQGVMLYTVALLRALWYRYTHQRMTVVLDDEVRQQPTLALTVAIGRREGNFVLAPNAILDDGLFDILHAGPVGRLELLRYLPRMVTGRLPTDHALIHQSRCRRVRLDSEEPLTVHLDGEFFCLPEDGVRGLEIHMLAGALKVQTARV